MVEPVIHKTFAQKFIDAFGFTPTPSGELTQEQLDLVVSEVIANIGNISSGNSYFPNGW